MAEYTLSKELARRLAITRQRLAGARPQPDAAHGQLTINAIHAEPDAPADAGPAVAAAIAELAAFLGAGEIVYGPNVPEQWAGALR